MRPDEVGKRIEELYEQLAPPVSQAEVNTTEVREPPRSGWLGPALAAVALVAVVASSAFLLEAFGPEPANGEGAGLIRVHPAPTGGGMGAIVTGVVEVDLDLGCVWLSDPGGARYPVVWPLGTTATANPFRLTFANGLTAEAGDRVTGGGGYVPASTAVGGMDPFPEACIQTGDAAVFNADSDIEVEEGVGLDQPGTLFGRFSLPEAIGFEMISVNPNQRSIGVTDFVTGTIHLFQPSDYASPSDAISGVSGSGGFIHVWANGTIYSYPGTLDADPIVYQPEPLVEEPGIAPTVEIVPAPDHERTWLIQDGGGRGPTIVELINLVEVQVTRLGSWEIDGSWQPAGATIDGVVLNSTDSDVAIVLDYDGSTLGEIDGHAISVGWQSVAVVDQDGTLLVTDARLGSPSSVTEPGARTWVGVGGPIIPSESPPLVTGAERLLVGLIDETGEVSLVVVEPSGAAEVVYRAAGPSLIAAWTRAGDWIVVVEGSDVAAIRLATGELFDLGAIIPPDHWVLTAG